MKSSEMTPGMLRAMRREPALQMPKSVIRALKRLPSSIITHSNPAPEIALDGVLIENPANDSGNAYIDQWLQCTPPTRTAQQKGVSMRGKKPHFYTKSTVKQAAKEWQRILEPIRPKQPLTGPLSFHVSLVFPWQKSASKKDREGEPQPHWNRFDCSNIIKMIEDVMTDMGFWEDDSQIYDLRVRKFRGNAPGISIRIGP